MLLFGNEGLGLPMEEGRTSLSRTKRRRNGYTRIAHIAVSGFMGSGVQCKDDGRVNDGLPVTQHTGHTNETGWNSGERERERDEVGAVSKRAHNTYISAQ